MEEQENELFGNLFGTINLLSEEHLDAILISMNKDHALYYLIESVKATVIFLPTYSPDFNPIELLWSKLKAFIRKHKPRSREALDNVVAQALDSVSLNDILGWFSESETRTLID